MGRQNDYARSIKEHRREKALEYKFWMWQLMAPPAVVLLECEDNTLYVLAVMMNSEPPIHCRPKIAITPKKRVMYLMPLL
jgi:hypothetical protein